MTILDCPVCETSIVGLYADLLDHVRDEHPLWADLSESDGVPLIEEIKAAQKANLKHRINTELVTRSKTMKVEYECSECGHTVIAYGEEALFCTCTEDHPAMVQTEKAEK